MKIQKLFNTQHIEEYIKKTTDLVGKRKYKRLPANVPVLYAFPNKNKKEGFKQAATIDVSIGGIAIEIINPPEEIKDHFLTKDNKIIMQIDIPSEEEMIEFTGTIRWLRNLESKKKIKTLVGIEYVKIDSNDKINILSYALKINRRKFFIKLSIIVLSIMIILTSAWGINTSISKRQVEKKLVISENVRSQLAADIKDLSKIKSELDMELQENTRKISEKTELLNKKEKQITNIEAALKEKENNLKITKNKLQEQEIEIKKTNENLEGIKKISSQLEERIYFYIVSSDQDIVFLTSISNTSILDNKNYKQAQAEMKKNKCAEAAQFFQLAINENPDSPIGYSGLVRAYNCSRNYKKSKEIFNIYLKIQQRELEGE